jgi:hypothetical protein
MKAFPTARRWSVAVALFAGVTSFDGSHKKLMSDFRFAGNK